MKMYLNMKTKQGVETVDEFNKDEHQMTFREFLAYVRIMRDEYRLAGMDVYISQRCTRDWKD